MKNENAFKGYKLFCFIKRRKTTLTYFREISLNKIFKHLNDNKTV